MNRLQICELLQALGLTTAVDKCRMASATVVHGKVVGKKKTLSQA